MRDFKVLDTSTKVISKTILSPKNGILVEHFMNNLGLYLPFWEMYFPLRKRIFYSVIIPTYLFDTIPMEPTNRKILFSHK